MADSITIKVSDLYDRAKQMKDDGMDFVELTILAEEYEDDDILPPALWLSATSKKESFMSIDYEAIDAIDED